MDLHNGSITIPMTFSVHSEVLYTNFPRGTEENHEN